MVVRLEFGTREGVADSSTRSKKEKQPVHPNSAVLLIIVCTGTTNTLTQECHSMLCLANMHNACFCRLRGGEGVEERRGGGIPVQ